MYFNLNALKFYNNVFIYRIRECYYFTFYNIITASIEKII